MQSIVTAFYQALNQNDLEAALKLFDPHVVRREFEGSPSGGIFRGLSELKANFTQGRSTWAEGSCSPEEFISCRDKLVVIAHVRVRLKDKTEWIDGHVADGFAFKDGKISEFHSFLKKEEALAWARE
jgi:hypothetical protein